MSKKEDLDLDALMELAASPEEETDKKYTWHKGHHDARRFVYEFDIKAGTTRVPSIIIFHKYLEWMGKYKKKESQAVFFYNFKQMFERHRTNKLNSYLLDPTPFDLSDDNMWRIRKKIRQQKMRNDKKKESNKKK